MKKIMLLCIIILRSLVISCPIDDAKTPITPITPDVDEGWNGDAKEPVINGNIYEIRLPDELAWVAAQITKDFSGITISFMADIDMNNQPFNGIEMFKGSIAGNGKKIMNLSINKSEENIGLIRILQDGGHIENLTIENGTVTGIRNVGAFVGQSQGSTTLSGLVNNATVIATNGSAGGIIGFDVQDASVQNTRNLGSVTANYSGNISNAQVCAGGIIGSVSASTIIELVDNFGNVTANYTGILRSTEVYAGGIVGLNVHATTIKNVGNSGNITATGDGSSQVCAGGIIGGFVNGSIAMNYVYNYGTINGKTKGAMIGSVDNATIGTHQNYYLKTTTDSIDAIGSGGSMLDTSSLTAVEFTDKDSFGAFWNFTTTWEMTPGAKYPTLRH